MSAVLVQIHNEKHYRAWEKFHQEHPEVYAKLVALCRECRLAGFQHYGIRGLWERMRWHFRIERGDDEFKLNDHMTAYYARFIMQQNQDLENFFETRLRGAEDEPVYD